MLKSAIFLFLFLISSIFLSGQMNIYPELSVGKISHLGRTGINSEIGIGFELWKRIDLSVAYRVARMDNQSDKHVKIDGVSTFLSYSLIRKKHHKLMIGSGLYYGKYDRLKADQVFEKSYTDYSWNIVKLSYNYIFGNGFKFGTDIILYGDDGDASEYFALNIGYFIF